MKKLLYLFLTVLIVACSDDDGNPCLYNPTLTTSAVTNITETAATLNGVISIVSQNCDDPNNTEQGFVYATTIQPTIANTKVNVNGTEVTTILENLEPNTTYYARTFLTNALGEVYGNEVGFITNEEQPCEYNLLTLEPTNITSNSATLNGTISIDEENCEFPITEQGFVYATTIQPTIANTKVNVNGTEVTTILENLEPNTTYYARTFLTNALGEVYGNEVSFTTETIPPPLNPVYLDDNGVTIKAYEWANIGDSGTINNVLYTIVGNNFGNAANPCTSRVTNMASLFEGGFNSNLDISSWDVGNVTDMSRMFNGAATFNQDISSWDVGNVTDMSHMFNGASTFNQDISSWDVGNVTDMSYIFNEASAFNKPIGNWDVSSVTDMKYAFAFATSFNQPIDNWDLGNVLYMGWMFYHNDSFNQSLGSWDVSNVTEMNYMFYEADAFNQPIGSWDVSNVNTMLYMFFSTPFNQPIGNWNVSNVTDMWGMFSSSPFNQPIGNWDVSNVTNMYQMFKATASYNQDLSSWNVTNVTFCDDFSDGATSWTLPQPNFTNCTP